jgi:hypothetical protein
MELEDGSRTLKREEQVTFGTENDIFVQVKRTKKTIRGFSFCTAATY